LDKPVLTRLVLLELAFFLLLLALFLQLHFLEALLGLFFTAVITLRKLVEFLLVLLLVALGS